MERPTGRRQASGIDSVSRARAADAKSTLILAVAAAASRYDDDDDDDDETYIEEFMRVSRQLVRFIFAKSYGRRPAPSRRCDATESPPSDVDDYSRQLKFTVHQLLQLLRRVYGCYVQGYNVCQTMETFQRA